MRLLLCVLVCVVISGCNLHSAEYLQTDQPRLEFAARRASINAEHGWEPFEHPGFSDGLYVSPETELSNVDVRSTTVERGSEGPWIVVLRLTDQAKDRFADLSAQMSGREPRECMAIFIDKRIVNAPFVMAPIKDGTLKIDGLASEREASEIARGIVGD